MPNDVLEHLLGLYDELKRPPGQGHRHPRRGPRRQRRAAPQAARGRELLRGRSSAPPPRPCCRSATAPAPCPRARSRPWSPTYGFTVHSAPDLPRSARSVTDLRNHRIYLKHEQLGMHTPRTVLLQTIGHIALGHHKPRDFADFLRQRVEANYFAAAVLVPEGRRRPFLQEAKRDRALSVEDLRDVFAVSYEMAAHRFTNLATHHLDLVCHFVRNDAGGIIYKAYENDGIIFPADEQGAIEGQRLCQQWSGRQVFRSPDRYSVYHQYSDGPTGTHFCVAHVDPSHEKDFAITLGVPFRESRWFRGRETTRRTKSNCPHGDCCRRPRPSWCSAGRVRLPLGPGELPRPGRAPARFVPRCRRGRRVRVPGTPRRRLERSRHPIRCVRDVQGEGGRAAWRCWRGRAADRRRRPTGPVHGARRQGGHDDQRRPPGQERARDGRRDRRGDPARPARPGRRARGDRLPLDRRHGGRGRRGRARR